MSMLGQLHPHYGKKDIIGIHRDTDLVLALFREHPEASKFRDRVLAILAQSPEKGTQLRNSLYRGYGDMGEAKIQPISDADSDNLSGIDHFHFTYQNLLAFRNFMKSNPVVALRVLKGSISEILNDYPLKEEAVVSIGEKVGEVTGENFGGTLENFKSHVERIAFLEGCISEGKCLNEVIQHAKYQREHFKKEHESSFEYWNYNNVISLAQTRRRLLNEAQEGGKSFSLSGGSGNAFIQLGLMIEYIKNGGKIRAISATSAGSAMAVIVGVIGHNPEKLAELMNDFKSHNLTGKIPRHLHGHEVQMKESFIIIAKKYGLDFSTKFSDLKIPILVNAGRQYSGGEQEIILGGEENVMDAIWASQNVPDHLRQWKQNQGVMGISKVHGVAMIDYAANERGNPTHWLEIIGEKQKDLVVIDVGYSSEKGGSPFVRRLYQRPTIRDFYAKYRAFFGGAILIDAPIPSSAGYSFPVGKISEFEVLGKNLYQQHFTEQV